MIHGRGLSGLTALKEIWTRQQRHHDTADLRILAAQDFDVTLTGDESICRRPMKRIMEPLSMMGQRLEVSIAMTVLPLAITGCRIHGIHYQSPVASAQVKSAVLLAGLYAEGEKPCVTESLSREITAS